MPGRAADRRVRPGCVFAVWGSGLLLVSIRDCRHSKKDRQWIQSVYAEYIDSLADLNTGLFSVIGADNPHEDEIFANWFSNDQSHPLLILKGSESVGFALVTRPRIPAAGEPAADYRMSEFFVRKQYRKAGIGPRCGNVDFRPIRGRLGHRRISAQPRRRGVLAPSDRRLLRWPLHGAFPARRSAAAIHEPAPGSAMKRQ